MWYLDHTGLIGGIDISTSWYEDAIGGLEEPAEFEAPMLNIGVTLSEQGHLSSLDNFSKTVEAINIKLGWHPLGKDRRPFWVAILDMYITMVKKIICYF